MSSRDLSPSLVLSELEFVALRGIRARQRLAEIEQNAVELDITRDLATVLGEIETRLGLESGSILKGNCTVLPGGGIEIG